MSIILENLTKYYGRQLIVDQVSLEIVDGELFVLLGASGSGKSTILRLIAGLTAPDSGRILLHDRDVTWLPPQERGTGFVFQNYSVFRHMNVAENVEFGLKIRGLPAAERADRREQLLDMVGLAGLGNRYADQLSGGQRQRVALARALAYEPAVLLLDEPFSALDVKIRAQLRRTLKSIQRELHVTTVLVTHDQDEAFELADRIGVVEHGRLLEVGDAEALYRRPETLFVATFLGAGTVLVGQTDANEARFGSIALPIPPTVPHEDGASVHMLIRPEHVEVSAECSPDHAVVLGQGEVVEQVFAGANRRVRLRMPRLTGVRQLAPAIPFGEEHMLVDALMPADSPLDGTCVWASLRNWHILAQARPHLLVYDTGADATTHLQIARYLAEHLRAAITALGIAPDRDAVPSVRMALESRVEAAELIHSEIQVREGTIDGQLQVQLNETVYDFVILAGESPPAARDVQVTRALATSQVPLLIVRGNPETFERILICTAAGEPGKHDVRVGGRLAHRLSADVTLLHVVSERIGQSDRGRRHLSRAAGTLRALDVVSERSIATAPTPAEGILDEANSGDHDLIVIGGHGPEPRTTDVTLQVVSHADRSVLVVPIIV